MTNVIPSVAKFGNKFTVICTIDGIVSMVSRNDNCQGERIEIDCYYETETGERVNSLILISLSQFITLLDLYEILATKPQGQLSYATELSHGG